MALICFRRGAVGPECHLVVLAAFFDSGFEGDQLALQGAMGHPGDP